MGIALVLPPLRDRRDDIPLLVDYYIRAFDSEIGKAISGVAPETMEILKQYSWPGNIRELQTVLKHTMLHAIGPILVPDFLPPELREPVPPYAGAPQPAVPAEDTLPPEPVIADSPPVSSDIGFRSVRCRTASQGDRFSSCRLRQVHGIDSLDARSALHRWQSIPGGVNPSSPLK